MPALRICAAAPKHRNFARKSDNAWNQALQNEAKKRNGSSPRPKQKTEWKKKKPVSKDVSGMFIIDREEVLQEEEIVPTPAWNTFASNSHGVWRGVGAVFSPDTAAVEPVGLGGRNEYLYDCRIVSFVESVPEKRSIDREVLWNLQNPYASKTQEKVQSQDELIEQDLAIEEAGLDLETDSGGEEGSVEDGASDEDDVEREADGTSGEEELTDGDGEFDDNEQELDDDFDDDEDDFDEDDEEELDSDDVAGVEDPEGSSSETEGSTSQEGSVEPFTLCELKAKHSYEGMKDVMEKETIGMEPGLVFFEDGAFSRGPTRLLRAKDDTTIARGYFYSPTHKVEQCLVRAGHKRVRICHTISVNDETDEVEVLRVAAYEEEWLGPVNEQSFRSSSNPELKLLSQRSRLQSKDLVGTWKVFEIYSSVTQQQDSGVFTCTEFKRRRRIPAASSEQEPAVLWLPGDIYTYVHLTTAGVLRIGAGWRLEEKTNLVIERDYDPDGELLGARAQTEILL
ncbi:uncharacterized protein LOC9654393 [Selaginella moellendorffii]|uniref:uncharacterized protein LOC9654393 n=1 Tax=Selaginella moellendorffii TaxID=88036 RepID=UPI000D1C5F05|nr:uncharacterized protein LOC9654393 [Selaginella moellendorffii]XP_024524506.1 uncharacterized protein LOC9654393 [Selaginella moellendorffii]XP_024524507.1 uncharacterized protein LOC9654393 [Selaginella moellendorffii]|eukprot:XP_024524504.1 uncharacterized protein LOC9654393 [Selaginella moellendorffii]